MKATFKNIITPNISKLSWMKKVPNGSLVFAKFLCSEDFFKIFWRLISMCAVITLFYKYLNKEVYISIADKITVSHSFIFWGLTLGVSFLLGKTFLFNQKDKD